MPDPSTTPWQLFAVNLDGSGRTQLTHEPAGVGPYAHFEWSADASRIAYVPNTPQSPLIVADLGLVGGELAVVGQTSVPVPAGQRYILDVAWANTRDQIVLAASTPVAQGGNNDLWLVDLVSPSSPLRLTSTADDERMPTFSRDDSRICFWNYGSAGGTYSIPAAGGSRTLVNSKAQNAYYRRR
jgi:Tol biopolymer transport system component